jgi:hypothetical protein
MAMADVASVTDQVSQYPLFERSSRS